MLPTLPGELIGNYEELRYLRDSVRVLLGLEHAKFPGAQPVSFRSGDLQRLKNEDYWVCEKSDGIRVLVYIKLVRETNEQEVYLIDRKNDYRQIHGLYFPHHEDPRMGLGDTILDGELVLDKEPSGREMLRLLAFDCIAVDGVRIMDKSLMSRYAKLQKWVAEPFQRMLKEIPSMAQNLPFDVKVKRMERSYSIDFVLNDIVPKLLHAHDGLIYTNASSAYVCGTDTKILKWKPPSENSVDFKLELRFPPSKSSSDALDYYAKPVFVLLVWTGGNKYDYFDTMGVSDDEWEKMKESGTQFDDRVVEVVWDFSVKNWKLMRIRDDKTHGNHKDVVKSVIESIIDGVEVDILVKDAADVRTAWKYRESHGGALHPSLASTSAPPPLPQANSLSTALSILKYVPMQPNEYGKVSGPLTVAGMMR